MKILKWKMGIIFLAVFLCSCQKFPRRYVFDYHSNQYIRVDQSGDSRWQAHRSGFKSRKTISHSDRKKSGLFKQKIVSHRANDLKQNAEERTQRCMWVNPGVDFQKNGAWGAGALCGASKQMPNDVQVSSEEQIHFSQQIQPSPRNFQIIKISLGDQILNYCPAGHWIDVTGLLPGEYARCPVDQTIFMVKEPQTAFGLPGHSEPPFVSSSDKKE